MRILSRSLFVKKHGTYRYPGSAEEICEKIISDCWSKKKNYFKASNGHFSEFYVRDFAFCCEDLMSLGYEEKVRLTLEYALKIFSRAGKITTAISPGGRAFDFPRYASDSLPLLVRSIKLSGCHDLIKSYGGLFVNEIKKYYEQVFDPRTGMVRADRHFSSIRDWAKRSSSCYDNCMLAMLREDLKELKFYNPFLEHDIKRRIKEELWNGRFFYDDMRKRDNVAGDANVFPFWTGVFSSREMALSCIGQIQKAKLDRPFPLKYNSSARGERFLMLDSIVSNYEGTTIWPHLGLCFIDVVGRYSKRDAKKYIGQYIKIIEGNRNMLEVFDEAGKPFESMLYYSDEGMIWASKMLYLTTNE